MKYLTAQQAVQNNFHRYLKSYSSEVLINAVIAQIHRESVLKYETEIEASEFEIRALQRDLQNLGYYTDQTSATTLYVSWFPSQVF